MSSMATVWPRYFHLLAFTMFGSLSGNTLPVFGFGNLKIVLKILILDGRYETRSFSCEVMFEFLLFPLVKMYLVVYGTPFL